MLQARWGRVHEVVEARAGAIEVRVVFDRAAHRPEPALVYPALTGAVAPGDRVLVNVTAVQLGLGTGGYHFVIAVDRAEPPAPEPDGHIVKLRYTPLQHTVRAVEEGPEAQRLEACDDLGGMPVVAAELHSQLAGIAAGVQAAKPGVRVAYVMPDTAALPLALSRLVPRLKAAGLLHTTITCGQAFGGDLEAVSVPSALAAARAVAGADVTIVAQGPGNAGTGTRLGFSGIAQAEWLHVAHASGGTPIAAVRLSFADARERHRGISHHTLTVLGRFTLCPVIVALPELPPDEAEWIGNQLAALPKKHAIERHDGEPALSLLRRLGLSVSTMGRTMEEERAFFLAAGAAGAAAAARLG